MVWVTKSATYERCISYFVGGRFTKPSGTDLTTKSRLRHGWVERGPRRGGAGTSIGKPIFMEWREETLEITLLCRARPRFGGDMDGFPKGYDNEFPLLARPE